MLELPPALRWHKMDYTYVIYLVTYLFYLTLLGLVVHCAEVSNCPLGTINYSSHAPCFLFPFQSLPHRARLEIAERASPRASPLARDVSISGLPLIGFILERLRVEQGIEGLPPSFVSGNLREMTRRSPRPRRRRRWRRARFGRLFASSLSLFH
uniref:Uncharacterized protein n=1 Tax=Ananas comosus var. bracteatus TaxID=296719 RepID=A0A6V7P2G9_ANACO|nr:unnamed protein product [Ananas comosus var. bracteatus]